MRPIWLVPALLAVLSPLAFITAIPGYAQEANRAVQVKQGASQTKDREARMALVIENGAEGIV